MVSLLAVVAAGAGGGLWFAIVQGGLDDGGYDGDLCPATGSGPSGLAVLLFDMTKPLAELPPELPRQVLRDLTLEVERDTEIRTYLLTGSSSAPRVLLKRLCKPFDRDAIQVATAKDHGGGTRDCDDLPAQMAPDQRRSAFRFCEFREALASRLDALAKRAWEGDWEVAGAHLVEALEQTRGEMLSHGGNRRVLHVISDMMQHADWYSHLDMPPETWHFDGYARLRDSRHQLAIRWEGTADIDVHIHYLPRQGLTAPPVAGDSHRRFWRRFFGAEKVTFLDQPPLRAYAAVPLMELAPGQDVVSGAAGPSDPVAVEEQAGMLETGTPEPNAAEQPMMVDRQAAPEPPPTEPPEAQTSVKLRAVAGESSPWVGEGFSPAARQVASPETLSSAKPQSEPDDPPQQRPAPLLEAAGALVSARATEDAVQTRAGIDKRMEGAAQAQVVETEARAEVRECSQAELLELLAQGESRWRPEYPGGFRNYGDAQLAVRYVVNDKGEVEPEGIEVLGQESVLEKPGYLGVFARQAVAAILEWRFPLDNSNGRICMPRASGYRTRLQFQF